MIEDFLELVRWGDLRYTEICGAFSCAVWMIQLKEEPHASYQV